MWYLFFQIWVWLLAAFVFGWFAHWAFCCRNKDQPNDSRVELKLTNSISETDSPSVKVIDSSTTIENNEGLKPPVLASQPKEVDDLKRIKGIGSVIEKMLNELGIYQFKQMADWSSDNVSWVENFIAFPGRISREKWQKQARALVD